MRRLWALGIVGIAAVGGRQGAPGEPALFHHLHLASPAPGSLVGVYSRLFRPESIERGAFWGVEGIQGRRFHLLVSRAGAARPQEAPTAIWHFGWGKVSLGESYAEHYRREVNWRPPYASLEADFHIHLRSRDPRAAAAWYRDALGGTVEWQGVSNPSAPVDAVAALVRFDPVVLAVHGMAPEDRLVSSRSGGTADHLAFLVRDPRAVKGTRPQPDAAGHETFALTGLVPVFIAGPDDVLIELLQGPRGPGFWHRPGGAGGQAP
jgi:catechol 2,3-dioxygenase-like lactoylglutathione lyase family enzyme